MKKHMMIAAVIVVAGLSGGTIATTFAANASSDKDVAEVKAQQSAKLIIADAIDAATAPQKDTASEVAFDNEKGVPVYEVAVVSADGTEQEVKIDAMSGKVIKIGSTHDENDEDYDGDGEKKD